MLGWLRHLLLTVLINAFLLGVWASTSGSFERLGEYADRPASAFTPEFWPVYPLLVMFLTVGIHLVELLGRPSRQARRRRRRARNEVLRRVETSLGAPDALLPDIPVIPGRDPSLVGAVTTGGPTQTPVTPAERQAAAHPPPPPASRVAVVLFSDLVGSTPLNETLGDAAYARVLRDHRALFRAVIARHGGAEVSTQGDGFLVRFETSLDAVCAACEMQRSVAEMRAAGAFLPALRIGIHAGEVLDDGEDLVGTVLNVAARVCGAASGGEVLVTEPVAEKVTGRISMVDRGLVELRGLRQHRHLLEVDWDDRHRADDDGTRADVPAETSPEP